MRIYVYLGAMKKRLIQTPMRPFIWILSFILVSGLVFGISLKNEDPNKDKLLLEIISYVLDRGHYDPKEINDAFSENVYMNFLENIDGQHRFFLKSDIKNFDSYKYQIDDEIKNAPIIRHDKDKIMDLELRYTPSKVSGKISSRTQVITLLEEEIVFFARNYLPT